MDSNEILGLRTKAFVTDLLAGVNIDDSISDIVSYAVKEVGQFTHADMVCIYEPSAKPDCVNKVYQWKADNSFIDDEEIQSIQERGLDN